MNLDQLARRVPADVERRVEQTRRRFNGVIRSILRDEMALRLSITTGGDLFESSSRESVNVPVKLCPGAPLDAANEINLSDVDDLAILIGQHRMALEQLKKSTGDAILFADRLRATGNDGLEMSPVTELELCRKWSSRLLERLAKADPLARILNFREDILGRYIYRLPIPDRYTGKDGDDPFKGEIELYWGVIGLCAELLNCGVQELAIVVIAHELAHAYTHIGADIDGERWSSHTFYQCEANVKEGLAQYYTRRVCDRIADRNSGALVAFEKLLPNQPAPYQTQESWIAAGASPEHVRLAMLESRRQGVSRLAQFEDALKIAIQRMGEATGTHHHRRGNQNLIV